MKVTGYKIRSALKYWELKLSAAKGALDNARIAFPDDVKLSPMPNLLKI